jgi:hypothetical protein
MKPEFDSNLDAFVRDHIYNPDFRNLDFESVRKAVCSYAHILSHRAFDLDDHEAQLELHRALYRICTANFAAPWEYLANNVNHPMFAEIKHIIEISWERRDRLVHESMLRNLPSLKDFESWVTRLIQAHDSNVCHPIFSYLKDRAELPELVEFIRQETPFDIYFGDIITLMLPGTAGVLKAEMIGNFWDEMGKGDMERAHKALRTKMTDSFGIDPREYKDSIEIYCQSELELANLYLTSCLNRSRLAELFGIMLCTENMVPGRLQCQIEGWRRVGVHDDSMEYLIEHTVVDVIHAKGWMNNVVKPIIQSNPDSMHQIVFGVLRRLYTAGKVCGELLSHIKTGDGSLQRRATEFAST